MTAIWLVKILSKTNYGRFWNAFCQTYYVTMVLFFSYSVWSNGYNNGVRTTQAEANKFIEELKGVPIRLEDLPIGPEITSRLLQSAPVVGSDKMGSLYAVAFPGLKKMKILFVESEPNKVLPNQFRLERSGGRIDIIPSSLPIS